MTENYNEIMYYYFIKYTYIYISLKEIKLLNIITKNIMHQFCNGFKCCIKISFNFTTYSLNINITNKYHHNSIK